MTEYSEVPELSVTNDEAEVIQHLRGLPNELREARRILQDIKKLSSGLQSMHDRMNTFQQQLDRLNYSENLHELIAQNVAAYLANLSLVTHADLADQLTKLSGQLSGYLTDIIVQTIDQGVLAIKIRLDEDRAPTPRAVEVLNDRLDLKLRPVLTKTDQLLNLVNNLSPVLVPAPAPAPVPVPVPVPAPGTGSGPIANVAELLASAENVDTSGVIVFNQFLAHMQAAKAFLSEPKVQVPSADAQRLIVRWEKISNAIHKQALGVEDPKERMALGAKTITISRLQGDADGLLRQRVS